MIRLTAWPLAVAALPLFAGCATTDTTDKDETDIEETDVAETDVVETDIEETDVEETDVPLPCAYDGTHTRVVLDTTSAESTYFGAPAVAPPPLFNVTLSEIYDDSSYTLDVTDTENAAVIVQFDPPITLQRAPSTSGYLLTLYPAGSKGFLGIDATFLDLTITQEGTLPFNEEDGYVLATGGLNLGNGWGPTKGPGSVDPIVGDTLSCMTFEFTASETKTYEWANTSFAFYENNDTTGDASPLLAPAE